MKNLFGKFTLIAALVIISLSSCEKDEAEPTINPNSYTGIEITSAKKENSIVTINGVVGKQNAKNEILSKVVIYKIDDKGGKFILDTYDNVNLNDPNSVLNTKLVGPYGKDTNLIYSFSKAYTVAELAPVTDKTKITSLRFEISDTTKVIVEVEMKFTDWGVVM